MDKKKVQGGSSTSFTSQLFGPQQPSPNDVFGSIFPPPKEVGKNSTYGTWLKHPTSTVNQTSNSSTKQDNAYRPNDASAGSKERNSIYLQEGGEPCYMSSSLYYGGQESYSPSTTTGSASSSYPTVSFPSEGLRKDGRDHGPSVSARGDWWQGSLYY